MDLHSANAQSLCSIFFKMPVFLKSKSQKKNERPEESVVVDEQANYYPPAVETEQLTSEQIRNIDSIE